VPTEAALLVFPPNSLTFGIAVTPERFTAEIMVNPIPNGPLGAGKKKRNAVTLVRGFPGLDFSFVLKALPACLGPPLSCACVQIVRHAGIVACGHYCRPVETHKILGTGGEGWQKVGPAVLS
jgi:hypothetical protein